MKTLSPRPKPLCIAVGHRANRANDKPLAVFVEECRKAAQNGAENLPPLLEKTN